MNDFENWCKELHKDPAYVDEYIQLLEKNQRAYERLVLELFGFIPQDYRDVKKMRKAIKRMKRDGMVGDDER